jgi:HEAT repeat protein
MFSWFAPKPPLDAPDKLWVEQGMTWLVRTFGVERLRSAAVVLPTPEFFPDPYDPIRGSDDDARNLLDRVCSYAGVDPGRVRLLIYPGAPEPVDDERRETIVILRDTLADPEFVVARFAHIVAMVRLQDDGKLPQHHPDLHRLADLLAVFLGLGVFVANHVIRESYYGSALSQTWSLYQTGHLSERAAGYALALFAQVRGETEAVPWARSLRPNVRQAFAAGLTYVERTGDAQFRLDEDPDERIQDEDQRLAQRVAALQAQSSGVRLAALWDLQRMGPRAAPALPALIAALQEQDPFLRTAAAEALGAMGLAAEPAIPALVEAAMQDEGAALRLQATCALAAVGRRAEFVVPHLIHLLRSPKEDQRLATIRALGALGTDAAVPSLVGLLTDVNGNVAEEAALALGAIGPDARAAVPALLRMLRAGGYLPAGAAYALGRIGRIDEAIVPALMKVLQHPVPDVREEAEIALRRIAPEALPDLPVVRADPPGEERIRPERAAGIMAATSRFTAGER